MARAAIVSLVLAGFVLVSAGAATGCGGSSSSSSDGSAQVSGPDREAVDAAMNEVKKRWTKNADGWITARESGSSFAPMRFLREMKEITSTGAEPYPLAESDKLNGFEWAGEVKFKEAPGREAGDQGIVFDGLANISADRVPGRWSQWVEIQPEGIKVQKVKGQWQAEPDTWLLRGHLPTAADYSNAGVK